MFGGEVGVFGVEVSSLPPHWIEPCYVKATIYLWFCWVLGLLYLCIELHCTTTCIWLKLLLSSTCTNIFFTPTFKFICTWSHCFLYLHIFFSSFSCRFLHTTCTYIKEWRHFMYGKKTRNLLVTKKIHYRHTYVKNFSYMWRQRFALCDLTEFWTEDRPGLLMYMCNTWHTHWLGYGQPTYSVAKLGYLFSASLWSPYDTVDGPTYSNPTLDYDRVPHGRLTPLWHTYMYIASWVH